MKLGIVLEIPFWNPTAMIGRIQKNSSHFTDSSSSAIIAISGVFSRDPKLKSIIISILSSFWAFYKMPLIYSQRIHVNGTCRNPKRCEGNTPGIYLINTLSDHFHNICFFGNVFSSGDVRFRAHASIYFRRINYDSIQNRNRLIFFYCCSLR